VRLRLLGRVAETLDGLDVPDFPITKAPDTAADPKGVGLAFHDGASPFIMKADGKGCSCRTARWTACRPTAAV
jgi:hypothetical protein